jgi:hypothetical protein
MTDWYMREIPESVRAAVEEMDSEICSASVPTPSAADPKRMQ